MDIQKSQLLDALISRNSEEACKIVAAQTLEEFHEFAIKNAIRFNDASVLDICIPRCGRDKVLRMGYAPVHDTLVQYACDLDHLECVKCLHKYGVDLNAESPDGNNALSVAVISESVQCIRWLVLERKAKEPEGFFALSDVIDWSNHGGRVIIEIMDLLLTNGFRLANPINDVEHYMRSQEFGDELVLKMLHLHHIEKPSGKMIGLAFLKKRYNLMCYMIDREVFSTELCIPSFDSVNVFSDPSSEHCMICYYLIRRYHFEEMIHGPCTHHETDAEEWFSRFYEECNTVCSAERVRPRIAFAGCTHKRLGFDSPIQQFLDVEMLNRIVDLSFSDKKTLKISFYS